MKKSRLPKLTPSEFEILDAVWNAGELTVKQIMRRINEAHNSNLTRSTIQLRVERLKEKGWLIYHQEGNKFFYRSTTPRSEASASIAPDIGHRIFGGSCAELVKTFFDRPTVTSDEIMQLRQLIDKHEE